MAGASHRYTSEPRPKFKCISNADVLDSEFRNDGGDTGEETQDEDDHIGDLAHHDGEEIRVHHPYEDQREHGPEPETSASTQEAEGDADNDVDENNHGEDADDNGDDEDF